MRAPLVGAAARATPGAGRGRRVAMRYGLGLRLFNAVAVIVLLIASPTGTARAEAARLLLLGDSLIAGYGLPVEDGFAARLEAALRAAGHDVEVIDAGVSGDTSAGGLARLDWALADEPTHAVVELGANDGLRGLDPAATRANLDAIVGKLEAAGVEVLLAGMLAPPNLGRVYGDEFRAIYPAVAEKHGVPLYPFFLDGVAAAADLNQDDGIHPNARGVAIIVERILPHVAALLDGKG